MRACIRSASLYPYKCRPSFVTSWANSCQLVVSSATPWPQWVTYHTYLIVRKVSTQQLRSRRQHRLLLAMPRLNHWAMIFEHPIMAKILLTTVGCFPLYFCMWLTRGDLLVQPWLVVLTHWSVCRCFSWRFVWRLRENHVKLCFVISTLMSCKLLWQEDVHHRIVSFEIYAYCVLRNYTLMTFVTCNKVEYMTTAISTDIKSDDKSLTEGFVTRILSFERL